MSVTSPQCSHADPQLCRLFSVLFLVLFKIVWHVVYIHLGQLSWSGIVVFMFHVHFHTICVKWTFHKAATESALDCPVKHTIYYSLYVQHMYKKYIMSGGSLSTHNGSRECYMKPYQYPYDTYLKWRELCF